MYGYVSNLEEGITLLESEYAYLALISTNIVQHLDERERWPRLNQGIGAASS